jgi:hypothetical protein
MRAMAVPAGWLQAAADDVLEGLDVSDDDSPSEVGPPPAKTLVSKPSISELFASDSDDDVPVKVRAVHQQ